MAIQSIFKATLLSTGLEFVSESKPSKGEATGVPRFWEAATTKPRNEQGKAKRPEPQIESPYLTAKQAAAYLNVQYGTFRNWATQIKKTRTGRYTREALDYFALHRKK
ncbi:MAG: helix-turn-helix domain-containing protein [Planctomycetes bacterium]|nr:helix-turn-helix domain-containing protein [Planctomycetota bacterium]